jgi:hypothetical protein
MKHLIARFLTSLMLVVMGLPLLAHAQIEQVVKTNIPFAFNFANKTFPAGDYTLVQPLQNLLVLRDARGKAIAQTLANGVDSVTASDATKLKFYSKDGQYFLTEVWRQADSSGMSVYPAPSRTNVAMHRSTEARSTAEGSQP